MYNNQPNPMGNYPRYNAPQVKPSNYDTAAAIVSIVLALRNAFDFFYSLWFWISNGIPLPFVTLLNLIVPSLLPAILFLIEGILLFQKKKNILEGVFPCIVAGIAFLYLIINVVNLFNYHYYIIALNFILNIIQQATFSAGMMLLGLWAIFNAQNKENSLTRFLKTSWQLPVILLFVPCVIGLLRGIQVSDGSGSLSFSFTLALTPIIGNAVIGIFAWFFTQWLRANGVTNAAYGIPRPYPNPGQYQRTPPNQQPGPQPNQQPAKNQFCPRCGQPLPDQTCFCPKCGYDMSQIPK